MKNKMVYALLLFLWIAQVDVQGQILRNYHKDPQGFLESQTTVVFKQAYEILDKYPPDSLHTAERKLALFALDGIYHDTRLDTSLALQNHFHHVVERVIDSVKSTKVDRGMQVFKVYNHGFIVKSPSVTIAIDLVRGSKTKYISDTQMQKLVDLSDILFVTHLHSDHADTAVAEMFAKQQKKVIVPTGLWKNGSPHYLHIRNPSGPVDREIVVDHQEGVALKVKVFPGHQGNVPNNVYSITTPEGLTVMHTGDQTNKSDLSWIKDIHHAVETDVLLMHCWMPRAKATLAGIRPRLIITGHENELGHTIDHREPYWLTFEKMGRLSYPYVIMAWGESYHYRGR